MGRIIIEIPDDLHDQLRENREAMGITIKDQITHAIEAWDESG